MNELLAKCYSILGLQENASRKEATHAYETLKQVYQGAEADSEEGAVPRQREKRKELNWAYDTLSSVFFLKKRRTSLRGKGGGPRVPKLSRQAKRAIPILPILLSEPTSERRGLFCERLSVGCS